MSTPGKARNKNSIFKQNGGYHTSSREKLPLDTPRRPGLRASLRCLSLYFAGFGQGAKVSVKRARKYRINSEQIR
jgi:hypothetical protein